MRAGRPVGRPELLVLKHDAGHRRHGQFTARAIDRDLPASKATAHVDRERRAVVGQRHNACRNKTTPPMARQEGFAAHRKSLIHGS
jgi:hypothetical protein